MWESLAPVMHQKNVYNVVLYYNQDFFFTIFCLCWLNPFFPCRCSIQCIQGCRLLSDYRNSSEGLQESRSRSSSSISWLAAPSLRANWKFVSATFYVVSSFPALSKSLSCQWLLSGMPGPVIVCRDEGGHIMTYINFMTVTREGSCGESCQSMTQPWGTYSFSVSVRECHIPIHWILLPMFNYMLAALSPVPRQLPTR